ncbi:hypothetical protein AB0B15_12280 [Streptomyces sp. NPDC045456]|uniref:hypothetical protein n=1 Tax=Streptomyces sp. NPDC045456 TaxID=3155254 RepID=UPI0033FB7C4D
MGTSQSKVDLYAAIRRDHRGGMSLRALQGKYNVTWRDGAAGCGRAVAAAAKAAAAAGPGWTPTSR